MVRDPPAYTYLFPRVIQTFFEIGDFGEDFRGFAFHSSSTWAQHWQFMAAWIASHKK